MESSTKLIYTIDAVIDLSVEQVGSKAKNISLLMKNHFKTPGGFCITSDAYLEYVKRNKLDKVIDFVLNRKPMEDMRWEEIWDISLRIQSAFLRAELNPSFRNDIIAHLKQLPADKAFSVRSSSTKEDSSNYSYAGIHESFVNLINYDDIIEKIKLVWASLWSNKAILYRKELSLNPKESKMAILVQEMVIEKISGLAFSQDPYSKENRVVIEAIEGQCSELVDNIKEPRKDLLNDSQYKEIETKVREIEKLFKQPVDVEWTGTGERFTVLQARPITTIVMDENKEREWYLTLTPSFANLKNLAKRVEQDLIPELQMIGKKLSLEEVNTTEKKTLAQIIKDRAEIYFKWKKIYWDDFIPMAHGIRTFGVYYNAILKPEDPFEFIELLKTLDMLAVKRNNKLLKLAEKLKNNHNLQKQILDILNSNIQALEIIEKLHKIEKPFAEEFTGILNSYFDIAYSNKTLASYPEIILKNIVELAKKPPVMKEMQFRQQALTNIYYQKAENTQESEEYLKIGRLSWRLRDDDNILLGRIENALLKVLNIAADILIKENKLQDKDGLSVEDWQDIYSTLIGENLSLKLKKKSMLKNLTNVKFRQLIGQPASKGIATGKAIVINDLSDFISVGKHEILVCDAIQPQMTFLIPLFAGIVERRGGMLVHSSIIAREIGIPAVNGVSKATEYIKTGDKITVNGYLGLVIIGDPELEAEKSL